MKKLMLWVIAAAMMALATSAPAQTRGTENLTWSERLGIALLSQELGVNPDTVLGTRNDFGRSIYEIAPMFVIRQHTNRDYRDIWQLRSSGLGWGQIAQRLNMHPGTFNKLRKKGHFDTNVFWPNIYERRFDLTDAQIRNLRNQGYDWDDIAAISHLSHRSGMSTAQVVTRFKTDRDWDKVRSNLKVSDDFRTGNWKVNGTKGKSKSGAKVTTSGKGKGNAKVKAGRSTKSGGAKAKSGNGGGNGKSKATAKGGGNAKTGKQKGGGKGKGKGGG